MFNMIAVLTFAQSDKKTIKKTITYDEFKNHVYYIASDELEGRDLPSKGLEKAGEYISNEFKKYGVKQVSGLTGYYQQVPFKSVEPANKGSIVVGDKTLEYEKNFLLMDGSNTELNATYVYANYGMGDDLKDLDVEGKIVVALCGNGEDESPRTWFGLSTDKKKDLKEKGAIALIEIYQSAQLPWSMLTRYFTGNKRVMVDDGEGEDTDFAHIWLSTEDKQAVKMLQQKDQAMSITVEGMKVEKFTSPNVVGWVEGSDPVLKNEFVVYGAHYDHVGIGEPNEEGDNIYNGTRDNAIGTSSVISLAKNIATYPTKRSALFILFTGEEKGLLGSSYFVENPPIPLDKMVYCLNIDSGGYNSTEIVTVMGLYRTTVTPLIEKSCKKFKLKVIDDPAPEQNLFDRSDNVNFAKKGIPAPTFSLGYTAFDDAIFKYYHQAADNPDSVDYDYLYKYCRSFMLTARSIANMPEKPFWTEGDKYYEAGVELYK